MLLELLSLSENTLSASNELQTPIFASSWATIVNDVDELDLRQKNFESVIKTKNRKIITVILDEQNAARSCRRAARFAVSKHRFTSIELLLVQIAAFFRVESSEVRKLYSLDGSYIRDINELIDHVSICIASSSEEINIGNLKFSPNGE
jgi:hypothetical protein